MGDIILIRPQSGRKRDRDASSSAADAQILLFTGVRYARTPEAAQAVEATDTGVPPAGGVGGASGGRRRRRG